MVHVLKALMSRVDVLRIKVNQEKDLKYYLSYVRATLYPYSVKDATKDREADLRSAVRREGALAVFRKLNAVAILQKNTSPTNSRKFIRDKNFVKKTYASQFKSPIRKKSPKKQSYKKKKKSLKKKSNKTI